MPSHHFALACSVLKCCGNAFVDLSVFDVMMISTCCVYTVGAAEASQRQGSSSMARKDAETTLKNLSQGSYKDTGFFQASQSVFCLPADAHSSYLPPGNQHLWHIYVFLRLFPADWMNADDSCIVTQNVL